jgi:hypothetical protein
MPSNTAPVSRDGRTAFAHPPAIKAMEDLMPCRIALAALLGLTSLAGCAAMETTLAMQDGNMSIEPHPTVAGARRVMFLTWPDATPLLVVDWRQEDARTASVVTILGNECPAPRMTEESRMAFGSDFRGARRERVYYLLEC